MTSSALIIVSDEDCLHLTLNLPDAGNRLSCDMMDAIVDALQHLPSNCRAVLLCAAGKDFSLGGALGDFRQQDADDINRFSHGMISCIHAMLDCPVPVLCSVHGRVEGGAIDLMTACDMVSAHPNATFAIPELASGLPPVLSYAGAANVLSDKQAMACALLSQSLNAEEALRSGLISAVSDDPIGLCSSWAQSIAQRNPQAIRRIKRLRAGGLKDYLNRLDMAALYLPSTLLNSEAFGVLNQREERMKNEA